MVAKGRATHGIDSIREQKKNIDCMHHLRIPPCHPARNQPSNRRADELEVAVDQAIAACDGDARAAIRALILANDFLENEVSELMKAVSHAYVRGRFQSYSG